MEQLNASYASIIRSLRADTGRENLAVAPQETIAAVNARYSPGSQMKAISALKKLYPGCAVFADEITKRIAAPPTQTASAKETERFMPWNDIIALRDGPAGASATPEERLLLGLYTYLPPQRLDYTPMRIVKRKPIKLQDRMNYLVLTKTAPRFIIHAYKTAEHHGDITLPIPPPLLKLIQEYIGTERTYLFQSADGTPWTDNHLGQRLIATMKRLSGKSVGASMFRHSYATHFHKGTPSIAQKTALAHKMGHSALMSETYRFINLQ